MTVELFEHVTVPDLPVITEAPRNGKRWYDTPGGCYPSVTTVLSWRKDGTGALQAWRERVGEDEAERIASESREVGTDMHSAIEQFLCGWPLMATSERCRALLRSMMPGLSRIDRIRHLEAPLYSDELRVAGRVDCIADYDGVLSVVDFKNSLRRKRKEWIEDYLLQVTMYARMYRERTGIEIAQGVVLIAVQGEKLQEFTIDTSLKLAGVRAMLADFHREAA